MTRPHIKVLEKTASDCLLELTVPSSLLYFKGHFDELPILPGITQVDWVIAFAKTYLGISNTFCDMRQLKFQQVIQPEDIIKLSFSFSDKTNTLTFKYFSDENGVHSSGRITYLPLTGKAN